VPGLTAIVVSAKVKQSSQVYEKATKKEAMRASYIDFRMIFVRK